MLKPRDIANKSFERASRGYKFEDVDIFMQEITVSYTELYETNQQLEQQLEVLAEKIEEYRESEDSLRSVLLGAQKLGDNIVRESRAKAEILTQEANAKAEAVTREATARAEAILTAALEKSKDVLAENERRIAEEEAQLETLKKAVADFKEEMLNLYRKHFELIAEIPDYEGEEAEAVQEEPAAESFTPDEIVEEAPAEAAEADVEVEVSAEDEEVFDIFKSVEEDVPEEEQMDFDSVAKEYDFSGLKFQFTDEIDKRK